MSTVGKFWTVLMRGIMGIFVIPVCFWILKMFIGQAVIDAMIATQPMILGFIIEIGFPVGYIIGCLAWIFHPLFEVDEDTGQSAAARYFGNIKPRR